jgi:hypothetical protein
MATLISGVINRWIGIGRTNRSLVVGEYIIVSVTVGILSPPVKSYVGNATEGNLASL